MPHSWIEQQDNNAVVHVPQLDDFRSHTCGECAWAYVWTGKQENFTCRRTGWMNSETGDGHSVSMSACPAFVAKTLEKNNVKL